MKFAVRFVFFTIAVCLFAFNADAQKNSSAKYAPLALQNSAELQTLLDRAARETLAAFAAKNFPAENLAVTLIDLGDASNPKMANFRGDQKIYPASVVKMFYLAAAHQWLKDGKINDTPELRRALKDMIVDSSNDATHQIVDILTDATGGAELPPDKLKKWARKREAVQRYFQTLGYADVNVVQKTYCEDIYGRERQFWNAGKNRNMLTTNATARLLAEIALGKAVDAEHSRQMLELLKRNPYKQGEKDLDNQDIGYTGIALKNVPNANLWSKAGWTSVSRHDAAYVEMPDGRKFVLVVFTEKAANERDIIPKIAGKIIDGLGKIK
jgi:beta-lactamase class A